MNKKNDIPSHYYNEAPNNVQHADGKPLLSLDPQFPVVLTTFEMMTSSSQADYPHRHDYYEVLYINDGEGEHVIDFETYTIQPPTFHFLSKGQIHFWQLRKPLKGYALIFPEEFMDFSTSSIIRTQDSNFFHHIEQAPFLPIDREHSTMFNDLIKMIEKEFNNEGARSLTVLRAYLHILLTELHRLYRVEHPHEHSTAPSSLARKFKQLVSEHFLTNQSAEDYARRIGVSTSHLRDTVKAVTGYAPGHIIRGKIVLEAKRLLAHSNETIAEIGYRLNFDDASYFGRFFKREAGMSPAVFRRQIREQYKIVQE
ncbi:helix-turn-helix domain-containing protein [Desulfosediminicola flagellatus]|uniref:helix-turn-helix domain-containing protein n=1 Tax=Desulfosediminicola flagellatus TaxID=2569541 RepID=UPI0010AD343F|nr:AraC family transcriptional regulator [Desulfosediminicola flagellatus]